MDEPSRPFFTGRRRQGRGRAPGRASTRTVRYLGGGAGDEGVALWLRLHQHDAREKPHRKPDRYSDQSIKIHRIPLERAHEGRALRRESGWKPAFVEQRSPPVGGAQRSRKKTLPALGRFQEDEVS